MGMPRTQTSYGAGDALRTTMGREGVDIGPAPDFEADWKRFQPREVPRYRGAEPRVNPTPGPLAQAGERATGGFRSGANMTPTYGKWTTVGGSSYLQMVPAGTPGASPTGYLPEGTPDPGARPMNSTMSGDINAPSRASVGYGYGGGVGLERGRDDSPTDGYSYLSPAERARWRGILVNAYGGSAYGQPSAQARG